MEIATMCSGIGSPEQALKELGVPHEIIFACEIEKYARQTYLANFSPGMMLEDMTKEDWVGEQYYADLLISGLPCQSFSLAGKRLGELDNRGILFFDFLRYVKNQSPKYFIIENVKGLLSSGTTFENWIHLLGRSLNLQQFMFPHPDSLNYNLHFKVLNSKNFGVPQNRERVFLVGIRSDLPNTFRFPKGWKLTKRLKDVLEPVVDEKYYLSEKMCNGLIGNKFINQDTQASQVHDIFGIAPTISAGTHGYALGYVKTIGKVNSSQDGRVFDTNGISQCLSSGHSNSPKVFAEPVCAAMRGRNPDNPNDRTAGANLKQTLEINEVQTTNALSTVQKDNLILVKHLYDNKAEGGRVYSDNGVSTTVKSTGGGLGGKSGLYQVAEATKKGYAEAEIIQKARGYNKGGKHEISPPVTSNSFEHNNHLSINYRIRRLTPLECFRLQGFPDNFIKPVSETRQYQQAGNTITVGVIKAIIKNLF